MVLVTLTLVLWVACATSTAAASALAGGGGAPPTAGHLPLPPRASPGDDAAAGAPPTSARITVNTYRVCRPGVVLRRTGVTCPCYFHWEVGAWAVGPTFNVTLSLSPTQQPPADGGAATQPGAAVVNGTATTAAAAAAAAVLSARAVRPAKPVQLRGGQTIFVAGLGAILAYPVTVDLVVTANVSAGGAGGICPAQVHLVLEPVEPACPLRDIRLGGDGEVLEAGTPSLSRAVRSPSAASGQQAGPWGRDLAALDDMFDDETQGAARPPRPAAAMATHPVRHPIAADDNPRLWAAMPPAAPTPTVRVVGGTRLLDPIARSFVVHVRGPSSTCTGCLISPRAVLTAAHCGVAPGHVVATLPAEPHPAPRTAAATAAMRTVPVERVVAHPDFSPNLFTADVAVVFLAADAPGYPSEDPAGGAGAPPTAFRPAAVNHDAAAPAAGSGVRVAGFGNPSQGWRPRHPDGRSVDVRVVPPAVCAEQLSGHLLGGTPMGALLSN